MRRGQEGQPPIPPPHRHTFWVTIEEKANFVQAYFETGFIKAIIVSMCYEKKV
jgi:hypothetical protein